MGEAITLERLQDEITKLRREVEEIKHRVEEDFELSDWAKRRLKEYEEERKNSPLKKR